MVRKKIFHIIRNLIIVFFGSSILMTLIYRFVPVYITPLMVIRCGQQVMSGEDLTLKHTWVPFEKISKYLPMAVIASEDNKFATHNGFDFQAIQQAVEDKEEGKKQRGASTISQQTAKNVFLWPESSWVRKGFEVYFTVLIETLWSKERIMEVYLNSIEMGRGIYGAEATARNKFHTTAKELSRGQCALIAATLPNPIKFDSANPSRYILRRILRLMPLMPKFPPTKRGK
jgi:monofunctional glycosyltransferase